MDMIRLGLTWLWKLINRGFEWYCWFVVLFVGLVFLLVIVGDFIEGFGLGFDLKGWGWFMCGRYHHSNSPPSPKTPTKSQASPS